METQAFYKEKIPFRKRLRNVALGTTGFLASIAFSQGNGAGHFARMVRDGAQGYKLTTEHPGGDAEAFYKKKLSPRQRAGRIGFGVPGAFFTAVSAATWTTGDWLRMARNGFQGYELEKAPQAAANTRQSSAFMLDPALPKNRWESAIDGELARIKSSQLNAGRANGTGIRSFHADIGGYPEPFQAYALQKAVNHGVELHGLPPHLAAIQEAMRQENPARQRQEILAQRSASRDPSSARLNSGPTFSR